MNKYFIISLKHSTPTEVVLWKANDAGYTTNPFFAGIYEEKEIKDRLEYYTDMSVPVPVQFFNKCGIDVVINATTARKFRSSLVKHLTSVVVCLFALLLSSCSLIQEPEYRIDPTVQVYVDSFYTAAHVRNVFPRNENLIVQLKDIAGKSGQSCSHGRQDIVTIDTDFINGYTGSQYATEIEVIVFHELGHALLNRRHTDNPESIMYPSPCINCYKGKPDLRKKYLDELFGV